MTRALATGACVMWSVVVALAQTAALGTPFRIEELDPTLDEIIGPDAKLEALD